MQERDDGAPISKEDFNLRLREYERRSAELKVKMADYQSGKVPFFTWPVFFLGLVIVAAMFLPFVSSIPPVVALAGAGVVALGIVWLVASKAKRMMQTAKRADADNDAVRGRGDR